MSRPVRIHIPGSTYLIHIRARKGVSLFSDEEDRKVFLKSMGDAAIPFGVKVYAFALLRQSALLFLRAGDVPLSKFVHRMQAGYFNRIRAMHNHSMPMIHDRHREILVEDGPLFLRVMQRVHMAPVIGIRWSEESEARKWGEVSTNRWTSFPIITGSIEAPDGFDKNGTLEKFAEIDPRRPLEMFYRYVIEGVKDPGEDILDQVVAMSLLGSEEFIEKYFEGAKGRRKIRQKDSTVTKTELNKQHETRLNLLARTIANEFNCAPHELMKARTRHIGRKFLVELALRHVLDQRGVKYLGNRLGVSGSALAHLRRAFLKKLDTDTILAEKFIKVEQEFTTL